MMKNIVITGLLFVLLLICGCGGGGGGDADIEPQGKKVNMAGKWEGAISFPNLPEWQTTFNLTRNGNDYSGACEVILPDDEGYITEDISIAVHQAKVTISVIYRDNENPDELYELEFEGTVNDTTYSGNAHLSYFDEDDGVQKNGEGTFSFTKIGGDQEPDPNPNPEPDPEPDPQDVDMSGKWEGSSTFQNLPEWPTTFNLTQNGTDYSGTCEIIFNGISEDPQELKTEDVSVTVNQATIMINVMFRDNEYSDDFIEFDYEGTVDGNTYSGNVVLTVGIDGQMESYDGTFSLTKMEDDPEPEPDPQNATMSGDWRSTTITPQETIPNLTQSLTRQLKHNVVDGLRNFLRRNK